MLALSALWLLIGTVIGLIANGGRLRPATWARWGWRALPATGAIAALLGGWLGTAVYGRLFGTPAALWVAIVGVSLGPWLIEWLRGREWAMLRSKGRGMRPI